MISDTLDLTALDKLSDKERDMALRILNELSNEGTSKLFNDIKYSEYKEIPVDIITFIEDDNYLGRAWHGPDGKSKLYPYWKKRLQELFPDNITTNVNNAIFSGSRGLGKSEIAVAVGCYLMYRVMCLKDAHSYFNLKPTEKICFAFMNITKILAEEIGISKFQETVKLSPWFMQHGTLTGRDTLMWNPPDPINIIIGSQASHVIGQPIYFCLDGDTVIITDKGEYKISELENRSINVLQVDTNGKTVISDNCTVVQTAESLDEYQIELEDGTVIKCTPNHQFMLKDGTYKEAQYLTIEDELFEGSVYGYIYKTTNKINNKVYIGQHTADTFNPSYLGSGNLIRRAVEKYGSYNFSVELLEYAYSKEHLNYLEKLYINKYNSTDKSLGYNIATGGQGGNNGKAVIRYFYKGQTFECRKELLEYLSSQGINVSANAIRNIINRTYGIRIKNKFEDVILNLTWEYK